MLSIPYIKCRRVVMRIIHTPASPRSFVCVFRTLRFLCHFGSRGGEGVGATRSRDCEAHLARARRGPRAAAAAGGSV